MGEQSEPGIFFAQTTHFSKYTHFSHPQISRSCTLSFPKKEVAIQLFDLTV